MKSMHKKRKVDAVIFHVVACVIGFFMIYPMLWLLASSFKSNETMFTNTYSLIPEVFDAATNYMNAWEGVAGVSFLTFLGNSRHMHLQGSNSAAGTSGSPALWSH